MSGIYRPIDRDSRTPAYAQVRETLLAAIRSGNIAPGHRLPPEPELAQAMGVSRMTANRAILSLVADGWLERAPGRGTFVSDPGAPVHRNLGVVIAEDVARAVENYYFGGLYFGLLDAASGEPHALTLLSFAEVEQHAERLAELDGAIFLNPPLGRLRECWHAIGGLRSAVILGATWPGVGATCVDSDNILGSALAVGHLADLGHRSLAFVGGCPDDANTQDRIRGFEVACRVRGVEPILDIPVSADALELSSACEARLKDWLSRPGGPTAIVVGGAILALHVARLVQDLGLSVPEDVSIIAYDDPAFLGVAKPAMTTVRQPLALMAKVAYEELVAGCEAPYVSPAQRFCPPELVVRSSTAAPPPSRTQ